MRKNLRLGSQSANLVLVGSALRASGALFAASYGAIALNAKVFGSLTVILAICGWAASISDLGTLQRLWIRLGDGMHPQQALRISMCTFPFGALLGALVASLVFAFHKHVGSEGPLPESFYVGGFAVVHALVSKMLAALKGLFLYRKCYLPVLAVDIASASYQVLIVLVVVYWSLKGLLVVGALSGAIGFVGVCLWTSSVGVKCSLDELRGSTVSGSANVADSLNVNFDKVVLANMLSPYQFVSYSLASKIALGCAGFLTSYAGRSVREIYASKGTIGVTRLPGIRALGVVTLAGMACSFVLCNLQLQMIDRTTRERILLGLACCVLPVGVLGRTIVADYLSARGMFRYRIVVSVGALAMFVAILLIFNERDSPAIALCALFVALTFQCMAGVRAVGKSILDRTSGK